ncbi:MAG: hypothetical protein PVJ86_00490 [Phycisphaerales bacterium]|jgi:hypothetical protein
MNANNFHKQQKKDLTKSDEADNIWAKLKAEAMTIGYGTMRCTVIVHGGHIVEIRQENCEKVYRA